VRLDKSFIAQVAERRAYLVILTDGFFLEEVGSIPAYD